MKTKAFYTAIATDDLAKTLKFYVVNLGFQVTHQYETVNGVTAVLENEAGAKIEVIEQKGKAGGFHALRTNVESLDDAIAEFRANGCEILAGPMDTATGNKAVLIADPNGVVINVTEHIKK